MTAFLLNVISNPTIYAKLQAECDQLADEDESAALPPYFSACLNETFRSVTSSSSYT